MPLRTVRLLISLLVTVLLLQAEEGMWTFDNPPRKQLSAGYHFNPTRQWLDHIRLSCVRFNDGGSGSFISPHGLVLTNHHIARDQLQKNSTAEHNYLDTGFYAKDLSQEMKSPDLEVNVLESMEDVTSQVETALKPVKSLKEQLIARRAVFAKIESESQKKTGLRSDIVTLYQGGEYWLYRYKKYTDVRLVFAPEQQIAFYGGDPDNFTYPRYDLDFAVFRIYENGKPLDSVQYLKWNAKGASDQELVFVAGHPGETERLSTMAEINTERDVRDPLVLGLLQNRIQTMEAYSSLGPEQAREASSLLFEIQNSVKAIKGEYNGLLDKNVIAKKEKEEADFKALVFAKQDLKAKHGGAWDAIAEAERKSRTRIKEEYLRRFSSELGNIAETIVEYVQEIKKPEGERLPGYSDSQLESLRFQLFSPAPVYPGLEKARIAGSLHYAIEQLGKDDPFLKIVLKGRTPEQVAGDLIDGTKLADPAVRKKLIEGGPQAVAESKDPMIVMARELDPMRRELSKWFEDNVQSVEEPAGEQLGRARFQVYGKSAYPDANFTLRLSYGQVKGYPMNGTKAPSKTTFFGLYDRAASFDGKPPFQLPQRWRDARQKLDLTTPLDMVTTNDIIGGNSGSPVINRDGEIVGLIFDGNIESLAGNFVYEQTTNRAVSVHTAAITEALRKVYGAEQLLNEILQPAAQ